jgi:hypothetical protein
MGSKRRNLSVTCTNASRRAISVKTTLETSEEDVENTLGASEEDVKTTLETSAKYLDRCCPTILSFKSKVERLKSLIFWKYFWC